MKLLTLDPSINNVGYALFNSRAVNRKAAWKWGTIYLEGTNLEMRMVDLVQQIDRLIGRFHYLVTEKPAFYSSEVGHIAAHQNYTIDLAAISFFVAGWFRMDHRHHAAITATAWKGSVSKGITARKFFSLWPKIKPTELSEHAIDAVMLGRYWLLNYGLAHPRFAHDSSPESLRLLI